MSEKIHKAYRDPTADQAINRVMREERFRFRKRVFICSPYAGDIYENTVAAKSYCLFAIKMSNAPFAPHLMYPRFLDDNNHRQREEGLRCGNAFLCACNELWVFGRNITAGMSREISTAKDKHIPIRFFDENCQPYMPEGGNCNAESTECSD